MKNLLILTSLFVLISCGGKTSQDQSGNNINEESTAGQIDHVTAIDDCDDFLDDYEAWVDEVIEVYQNVRENPMDTQNTQKLMETTAKMQEWSERWTQLYDCANNEKYAKRMQELEERVEKEMSME